MMAASRYIFMVIIINCAYSAYGQECGSTIGSVFSICELGTISGTELFLNLQIKPEDSISFCKCSIEFTSSSRTYFKPQSSSNVWCYYNFLTIQDASDGSKTQGIYDCNQDTWSQPLFFRVQPTDLFEIRLQRDEYISPSSNELKACIRIESNISVTIRCQDANQSIDEDVSTTTSTDFPMTSSISVATTTSPPPSTESLTTTSSVGKESITKPLSLSTTSQLPMMTAKGEVTTTREVTTQTPPMILSALDGIIIGSVIAAIVFIFLINCIICLCRKRKKEAEAKERHRKMKYDEDINMPTSGTMCQSNPIFDDRAEIRNAKSLNGFDNLTFKKENELSHAKQEPAETECNGKTLNHAQESNTAYVTDNSTKGDYSENPHAQVGRDYSGMYSDTITNDEDIYMVIEIPDTNLDHPEIVEITNDIVDISVPIEESKKSP